ncbi:MAG: ABC transporter permease [Deltaproteobacteria bacterium]|nr:ABC transporter permease [Deltaproteobacteria bacterium]
MRHRGALVCLLAILIGVTVWVTSLGKVGIYSTFTYGDLFYNAWVHLEMVFIAVCIATAIGVPLGILVTRPGLHKLALVIYGILPIIRNAYASIRNIDPAVVEAAKGMGLNRLQIARRIELPLARPVIMAGIRISTVITVGTAELAVLVGGAGLGKITLTGVFAREVLIILQGAAPTAAMAITLGFLLECMEKWMTPRGLRTN